MVASAVTACHVATPGKGEVLVDAGHGHVAEGLGETVATGMAGGVCVQPDSPTRLAAPKTSAVSLMLMQTSIS